MDGNQGVGAGMALGLARAGMAGRSACGMGPGSGALLRRAWGLWRARAGGVRPTARVGYWARLAGRAETSGNQRRQLFFREHKMSDTQQYLNDFMTGYARRNLADAQLVADFEGWRALAQRVLDARREDLLRALGDHALQDIAAGRADLAAAARDALAQR